MDRSDFIATPFCTEPSISEASISDTGTPASDVSKNPASTKDDRNDNEGSKGKLIDSLKLPEGLRGLSPKQLQQLSNELRDELIDSVSSSGGHFASSLGATEITVALHSLFNTPKDKIIWDVGHQCYIHKMLTGRRNKMSTIRTKGGISGFLKREESDYDVFGAGHAGTSISAAVGIAQGLLLSKSNEALEPPNNSEDQDPYVVAVIGDGSLTSGMAFEAMNHAGDLELKKFIVVLNDNDMSISPNVGALSWLFSKTVTGKMGTSARTNFKELYKRGYVPELVYKVLDRAEEAAQSFVSTPMHLFQAFGFRYIGPIDGNNIEELVVALEHAKTQDVPVIVHARTVKGKGYEPAEEDPGKWHGVNPFDRNEGKFISKPLTKAPPPTYTKVFSDCLIELAKQDEKIVAITAAMLTGTGLDAFGKVFPKRCFDVGICEQHAVTFAAGLAVQGLKPVCAIYSTFLQRAFDQIVHDVCIQALPVVFCLDRAGVVGNDGETHQGLFDIAYLRSIPGLVLMSPKDEQELSDMLLTALSLNKPVAIRYPRGNATGMELSPPKLLAEGKAEMISPVITDSADVALISYGPLYDLASKLRESLEKKHSLKVNLINARFAKPLDHVLLREQSSKHKLMVTIEDHATLAGFGSAVIEALSDEGQSTVAHLIRCGTNDHFTAHASQSEQHQEHGITVEDLEKRILLQLAVV